MHLSTLGLAPLLFALGTQSQSFVQTVTTTDGALGLLRGCYSNVGFNFFDTTAKFSQQPTSAAVSVQACVQACRTNGSTYSMIQGYNSK